MLQLMRDKNHINALNMNTTAIISKYNNFDVFAHSTPAGGKTFLRYKKYALYA